MKKTMISAVGLSVVALLVVGCAHSGAGEPREGANSHKAAQWDSEYSERRRAARKARDSRDAGSGIVDPPGGAPWSVWNSASPEARAIGRHIDMGHSLTAFDQEVINSDWPREYLRALDELHSITDLGERHGEAMGRAFWRWAALSDLIEPGVYADPPSERAGMAIFKNDHMLDLERTTVERIDYSDERGTPMERAQPSGVVETSRALMRRGEPPVGPDSLPVQVCRGIDASDAPYAEIRLSTARQLFDATLDDSVANRCLSHEQHAPIRNHWKDREGDLQWPAGTLRAPATETSDAVFPDPDQLPQRQEPQTRRGTGEHGGRRGNPPR